MSRREPTPEGRARQEHPATAPTFIEKADGRLVSINWPEAGQVTVRHPSGREEVLTMEVFAAQERARQG